MDKKCDYLIIQTWTEVSDPGDAHYDGEGRLVGVRAPHKVREFAAFPISSLSRGLFDWSEGREIITRIHQSGPFFNIYMTRLTEDEADAINAGEAKPPEPNCLPQEVTNAQEKSAFEGHGS